MSGRSFSVYLSNDVLEWVDREVEREKRKSRSNYIEKVLREKMEEQEELAPGETRKLLRPLART